MNKQQFTTWAMQSPDTKSYTSTQSKLALATLPLGYDWYEQNKSSLSTGKDRKAKYKRRVKSECRAYIYDKFKPNPADYGYSSVFVAWIFYWILSAVINFVIRRLLDDWIFKN